jgi:uncharacterized protein YcbK (DUF882 family)
MKHLRKYTLFSVALAGLFSICFVSAIDSADAVRRLKFYQTHTEERLTVSYKIGDSYLTAGLNKINYIMRDYRTGEVHPIDPELLDFLYDLLTAVNNHGEVHIISGYRSLETNRVLHKKDKKGVSQRSLHMKGKALDFRLPGTDTKRLRDTALAMKRGGVGYYPASDFIQIDTGRVRFW